MKSFAMLLFVLSIPGFSFAAQERGGGNAVICRSPSGTIQSAELLDLWEGRLIFGETPQNTTLGYAALADGLVQKLQLQNRDDFEFNLMEIYQHVVAKMKLMPAGVVLAPISDSFPYAYPKDCAIEQVAAYLPSGDLLVNSDIWKSMLDKDKAGLIIHETIYKYLRKVGAKDSLRARRIVSALQTDRLVEPAWHGGVNRTFWCSDLSVGEPETTVISGYSNSTDSSLVDMYVSRIKGQPVVSIKKFTVRKTLLEASNYDAQIIQFNGSFESSELSYIYYMTPNIPGIPYAHQIEIHSPFGEGSPTATVWLRCQPQ